MTAPQAAMPPAMKALYASAQISFPIPQNLEIFSLPYPAVVDIASSRAIRSAHHSQLFLVLVLGLGLCAQIGVSEEN